MNFLQFLNSKKKSFCGNYMRKYGKESKYIIVQLSNGFAKIRCAIWIGFIFTIEFTILDSITLLLNWNALYISILFFTLEFFNSITSFRTVFFILSQLSRIENIIQKKHWVKPKLDLIYHMHYARHYKPRLVYFFTPFSLWFIIKSG